MSVYSGEEPAAVLAIRARLSTITTESCVIQDLSAQMRQSEDPTVQGLFLQVWLSEVRRTSNPTRLLALCYLANDVIQNLKGSEQSIVYRYNFAGPLAEAIIVIRQRASAIVPKIARVINIFAARSIYDTRTLTLLQRALQDEISTVLSTVLPVLVSETTVNRAERVAQLEKDILEKQKAAESLSTKERPGMMGREETMFLAAPLAAAHTPSRQQAQTAAFRQYGGAPAASAPPSVESGSSQSHPSSYPPSCVSVVHAAPTPTLQPPPQLVCHPGPPPSFESLATAAQALKKLHVLQRSPDAVNLDAESVSRLRGYRVPLNAAMSEEDTRLLTEYRLLVNENVQCERDIQEKMDRRSKEEDATQFFLLSSKSSHAAEVAAASRVGLLLRKEWNLRCHKLQLEHSLYWHLVDIASYLCQRLDRLHAVVQGTETEAQRRNDGRSSTPITPQ